MFIEFFLGIFLDFLKFDFSDCVVLIILFVFGFVWGVGVEFLKNVFYLFVIKMAGIGEFVNFMIGGFFVYIVGYIYGKNRIKKGAVVVFIIFIIVFFVWVGLLNYFVFFFFYEKVLKFLILEIVKIAVKVNGFVIDKFILILFLIILFNLVKGIVILVVIFVFYKRLLKIVKR